MLKNIFITSIWDVNLNFNLDSLKKEINEITKEDEGRIVSNQGGYQSKNIDIQKYTHINFLSQAILTNSDSFKKELNLKGKLILQNMWINKNYFKDYNILLNHPNSFISGVYYVQCPKESGAITFENPAADGIGYVWNEKIIDYNNHTSSVWNMTPKPNRLLLFPSFLKHCVKPNLNKEERVSLSFNLKLL